jgi:hypothetical protein
MGFRRPSLALVRGHFSISRNKIRAGIEVRFEAVNRGCEPIQVTTMGTPGIPAATFGWRSLTTALMCKSRRRYRRELIFSCISGAQDIAPGHKYTESFWIGRDGEFSRTGKYHIDVTYYFAYDKRGAFAHEGSPGGRFDSQFTVTVEKPAK